MDELLDSLYSNFALAELDPSGDSRPAGNLGAGFIRLTVTHNSRLDSSQGWVAKEMTLPQFECLLSMANLKGRRIVQVTSRV